METFLKQVAFDLYDKTDGNLSDTVVVFPNKRAALFFNEYLAQKAGCPIWSPAYISISELFQQMSQLQTGDPVKLVCNLHKVFCQTTGSNESLDSFYFWGELLISDFDDADKNLVNTDALFSNLKELNQLGDSYEFLEEGQKEALKQFFSNFSPEQNTILKQRFSDLWNNLGSIYRNFKKVLQEQGLAYEGMLYRDAMEHLEVELLPHKRYVFVGFNVLNKVEHTLFSRLHEAGMALFYWDYDEFYMNRRPHEAAEFIRRNLRDFPSELPPSCFRNLHLPKEITYVEAPGENAQTKFLPQWIEENLTEREKETAVVLCNEALLQPILHGLPEKVKEVNITMGFPMTQTPAYSLVNALLDLYIHGYHEKNGRFLFAEVAAVLKHPYILKIDTDQEASRLMQELIQNNRFYPLPSELQRDELLTHIFTPCTSNSDLCQRISYLLKKVAASYKNEEKEKGTDAFTQLYQEALFKAFTQVNRFYTLMEGGDLELSREMLVRLIMRVLSAVNIPFHGEPAIGMQVMGVLETRNLDFRNMIVLSVNEGQLPKSGGDTSFIPYNLRKAFGMTTIDHKIAVFAYYFYRMLQRAEKVTLVYNNVTSGTTRGEMSRFMLQFLIEWEHEVKRVKLKAPQSPMGSSELCVAKDELVMDRLLQCMDTRRNPQALLSPSALNTYLDCPLKFYFRYVAGLKEPKEVSAEIDSAKFGTIFHFAAQKFYEDLSKQHKVITKALLNEMLEKNQEHTLRKYVDWGFKEEVFHIPLEERADYNGLQYLQFEVIYRYLRQLLRNDSQYAPFSFLEAEKKVRRGIKIMMDNGESVVLSIGGTIDRIDRKESVIEYDKKGDDEVDLGPEIRILDYKTGGDKNSAKSIEALYIDSKDRPGYIFQTFLYSWVLLQKDIPERVKPALLYIHKAAQEGYTPELYLGERSSKDKVQDVREMMDEFEEHLVELLQEIFNPEKPFCQTEVEDHCTYCEFKKICRK